MLSNATNLMPKNAEIFECKDCDFKCSKKSNYDKHILTLKHTNKAEGYKKDIMFNIFILKVRIRL